MNTFQLIQKCCPSKLVNAWKVWIGSKPYLVTPAHVCIYGVNGRWTMSELLKELSLYDWKISASYISQPHPFYDLAWTALDCSKEECVILGSGIRTPTKVDVFFRQPFDHNGCWVAESSEIGQTEAMLYPSPAQSPESSEGDLVEGGLVEAVDLGFRGMSGALAMRHGAGSLVSTCEGMFIKRGSLRPFKKIRHPLDPDIHMNEDLGTMNRRDKKYNTVQRALRGILGIDRIEEMLDASDKKLDHLVRNGLVKSDLHEIGVVLGARRGIFLPANMMTDIVLSSAAVRVKDIIGKKAPLLAKC